MSRQAQAGAFLLQGHVMAAEDILAMWTVEWVMHRLDLTALCRATRLGATDEALAIAARTVEN